MVLVRLEPGSPGWESYALPLCQHNYGYHKLGWFEKYVGVCGSKLFQQNLTIITSQIMPIN